MKINKNQQYMTMITNKVKAEKIANTLNNEGRLAYYLKYKNYKNGRNEYYIFYYCYR